MAKDIYGPRLTHLKGKIVLRKIQHMEPVNVLSVTKTILDKYEKVAIFCDLININIIGFLNTIMWHIMFVIGSMTKNRKMKNIADGITQVHKLYLKHGLKVIRIQSDS